MLDIKMPDVNTVLIAGNLTCDPSFRKTTNGTPVANFYIASNRKFKDNTGQWRENVCYVGVVAWYKLAESCYENLKRGSAIIVDGELQSRSWRNEDGTSRNVVEIKARRIQFLNRRYQQSDMMKSDDSDIVEAEADGLTQNENSGTNFSFENDAGENKTENIPAQETDNNKTEAEEKNSDFNFGYNNLEF